MQRSHLSFRPLLLLALGCLLLTACGPTARAAGDGASEVAAGDVDEPEDAQVSRTSAGPPRPAAVPARSQVRAAHDPGWAPFATVGTVTLVHPSAAVELVGFHESNHDGAQQMQVVPAATPAMTLESRERGTGSRSAADIVVAPDREIRAVVTGTVLRAGSYVLYCDHTDDFAVIEPDGLPGWEVKVLHIDGVRVSAGDRVEAGETVLAGGPTQLPFASQVDEHTADPSWPHVHVEVVDTSIPDRPSPGGGC